MSEEGSAMDAGNPEIGSGVPDGTAAPAPAEPMANQGWAGAQYDEVIQAKGWSNPDDVLQSYVNLEKAVGADKVALPAADSNIFEWDGWQALGVPDQADAYALAAPEGMGDYDQTLSDDMRQIFHDARLTPQQAQFIHDKYVERYAHQADMSTADNQVQIQAWDREIRQEYGSAYEERIAAARNAVREFGGDNLATLMDETGLGNNPEMIRAFVRIGMQLGQGGQFKEGTQGGFGITPADAQEQIAAIRANPALTDSSHPEYKVLNDKLTRLYELAYPPSSDGSHVVSTVG